MSTARPDQPTSPRKTTDTAGATLFTTLTSVPAAEDAHGTPRLEDAQPDSPETRVICVDVVDVDVADMDVVAATKLQEIFLREQFLFR